VRDQRARVARHALCRRRGAPLRSRRKSRPGRVGLGGAVGQADTRLLAGGGDPQARRSSGSAFVAVGCTLQQLALRKRQSRAGFLSSRRLPSQRDPSVRPRSYPEAVRVLITGGERATSDRCSHPGCSGTISRSLSSTSLLFRARDRRRRPARDRTSENHPQSISNVGRGEGNHIKTRIVESATSAVRGFEVERRLLTFGRDIRDVTVSSAKIADCLGFKAAGGVASGAEEVRDAITSGLIKDPGSAWYRNRSFSVQ